VELDVTEAVIAAVAGLVGVLVGFLLKWGEFRREQRLEVYTSLLSTFLAVMDCAPGPAGADGKRSDLLGRFRVEALRARMVATRDVESLLDKAEALVEDHADQPARAAELARDIAHAARRDVSGPRLTF
jgi:hypothetical protein